MNKIWKAFATTALSLCMLNSQSFAFSDVAETDWYHPYIQSATDQGFLTGYEDDTFRPSQNVTLAEFCVMISNAYYGTSLAMIAEDDAMTQWWEPYVYTTQLRDGLVNTVVGGQVEQYKNDGYRFNRWSYYVNEPVNRYDAAAMLTNVLIDQYVPKYTEEEVSTVLNSIPDIDGSHEYALSIAMAYDNKLMFGYHESEFKGENSLNRAEAAVLLSALSNHEGVSVEKRSDAASVLASDAYNMSDYDLTGYLEIENYVFARVNELRTSLGLNTLTANDTLLEYANIRAKEAKENWAHVRPDGSSWDTVKAEDDLSNHLTGENLAKGIGFYSYEYADMIFKAWLNSPSHYSCMIAPFHQELGIAVYVDENGGYYSAQTFGVPLN